MVSRVPLGRLGTPHEVASLCDWLASEDGAFVSGQLIGVNGAAST
jgi:NAD(P)-dependent dehydrogenase (short-subunit alcohol dehydrogenase family)